MPVDLHCMWRSKSTAARLPLEIPAGYSGVSNKFIYFSCLDRLFGVPGGLAFCFPRLRRTGLRFAMYLCMTEETSSMSRTASDPLATPPARASRRRWWQQWMVAAGLAALLGAVNLIALHAYFQEDARASRLAEEQAVLQQLSIVRAQLESYLNGDLYQVKGLIGLPMANPDIDEHLFARIAAELAGNDEHIKSLQLAPDGIVPHVWPYEANRGAIGHDLLGYPARRVAAQRAIEARQLWVAGPVALIQSGTAIIGRYPIFVHDHDRAPERFWGFATVLIDWYSIVERTRQAAGDPRAGRGASHYEEPLSDGRVLRTAQTSITASSGFINPPKINFQCFFKTKK